VRQTRLTNDQAFSFFSFVKVSF